MAAPANASPGERAWYYLHRLICGMVLLFLIAPIVAIIPLSFSSGRLFSYPIPGLSLRWYEEFLLTDLWRDALYNSVFIAVLVTLLSTALGTLASLGLSRSNFPLRGIVMSILTLPLIVPIVIKATGVYFFYANIGLLNTYTGLILAHAILASPFVVITVTATLTGFDHSLTRAAAGLGAPPITVFFKIILPLILPGLISSALFAFFISFNEVVVALFIAGPQQRTLPMVMFSGIREQISPTITAASTIMVLIAIALLTTVELRRRHSERLRGIRST
ncbi:ABC transporter permease [Bradyrhizobium sp. ISRA442]|uniref:ABC transporter permease n=1 Tax=Bradyrhizobium sp. ISRA442 TaxID=2866197 RepID=UPI00311AC03D